MRRFRDRTKHDRSQRREKPPILRVPGHNAEMGQMEQGKQALEEIVGAVQRDVVKMKKEKKSYVNTWENNGKPDLRIMILLQD